MTTEKLLAIPPDKLAAISDADLAELLSPLFPQARLEFIGRKEETITIAPGVKRGKRALIADTDRLIQQMKQQMEKLK